MKAGQNQCVWWRLRLEHLLERCQHPWELVQESVQVKVEIQFQMVVVVVKLMFEC